MQLQNSQNASRLATPEKLTMTHECRRDLSSSCSVDDKALCFLFVNTFALNEVWDCVRGCECKLGTGKFPAGISRRTVPFYLKSLICNVPNRTLQLQQNSVVFYESCSDK